MIAHQITLEWSDGAAELLVLAFPDPANGRMSGRIIARWGSGITSHVGAYRFDLKSGEWTRETVPFGYRLDALAGAAGDTRLRENGWLDDTITARSVSDPLACAAPWLRDASPRYSSDRALTRAVAGWLLGMRSTLASAHGFDLLDALLAAGLNVGNGTIDDMLGELVRLGVIYPHACMPRADAIITHDTRANIRACFAGRFGSTLPNVWAEHTAGAKHWLYQCGPAWEACTGVRGGYPRNVDALLDLCRLTREIAAENKP